eukprot:s3279_g2.t5
MLAQDRVGSDAQAEAVTVVLRQRDLLMRRMPGLAKQHQSPPREPCLSADDVQKLTAAEMTSMALLLSLASTKALLHLLGFGFGLEKLKPFGVTAELLGVLVDLTKAAEGIIQVRNKPSRIDQLKPILDEALSTGTIVPASLPSFLGKLQYADAQLFGRAGRLALADLRKLGHFSRVPASLDASCRTALEILKERLLFGKPRTLTASWREPPFLLFTDGALEQSASLGCEASIGAVLFPPGHGRAQVFGCAVPEPVLAHWRAAGSHHVIGIVELYAIVVALRHWRRLLRGRRTIVFVDNWSALDVMVRGNGDVATWRELLLTLENPEENVVSCLWIARVPSKSNISDGPSRACLDELTPFKPEIVGIPTVWRRWSPERRPSRLSCDVILEILFVTGTGVSRLQRFGYVAGRGRHSGPFGGGQHSHNSHIRLIPWHAIDFVEAERALQAPGHELMDGGPLRSTSSREASASGLSGLKASGIFSLIDPRAEQVSASVRLVVPGASLHRNSLLDLQLKDASSCGSAVSCATRENGGKSREMQFLPRARDAGHSSPTYRGSFAHATSWRCSRLKETKLRGFRVLRLVQLWVDRGILSAQEAEEVKAITPLVGTSLPSSFGQRSPLGALGLDLFVAERFGNCLQLPARRGSLSFVGFELDVGGRGQITLWCSTASVVLRDKIVVPFADELLREAKLVPGHPRAGLLVPHRARSFCGSARADSRGNLWRIMTMVVSVLVLMLSKFDLEQRRASRRCLWHAAAASVYHFAAAPEICHQRQLVPPLPWCHYIIPVAPQQDYQAVLCTNCGSLCGADYHFCPFCGTSICWVVAVYFQPEWQMPEQPQMTESVAPVERPAEAVWCLDCAWQEHISAMDLEEVALKPGISVEPVAGGGGAAASSSVRVQAVEAENWAESEQLLNERPKEGDVNVRTADWNYSLRVYLSPAAGA